MFWRPQVWLCVLAACRFHFDEPAAGNDAASVCEFAGGSHDRTEVRPDGRIGLAAGELVGRYTTPACAWGSDARSLRVVPAAPYGKPLPTASETGYPDAALDATALVGLWHLDGVLGTIAAGTTIDEASGASPGVARNADGTGMAYAAGVFGSALECDGVDDHVEIAPSALWRGFDQATVQVWASADYSGPSAQFMRLVSYWETGDTLGSSFQVSHFPSGVMAFMTVDDGGGSWFAGDDWNQTAGQWHHVVGVYDGTTTSIYIDGVEGIADSASGALQDRLGPLYFCQGGSSNPPPVYEYDGRIDEVALWKRVLTTEEIRALHTRGTASVRAQVRTCDDPTCTGQTFAGPDGTPTSYYSEEGSTSPELATFDLAGLRAAAYVQVAVTLTRTSPSADPELVDVLVSR